jgi:hypothetical protein
MNAAAVTEEVSRQVGTFMKTLEATPLSLALVVMNFALVAFLFYSNSQVLEQRQSALTQIVDWQQRTDSLMASCVSIEVMKLVVDALERDRSLYRQMLPQQGPPAPAPPQEGPRLQDGNGKPVELPPLPLFTMPP